MFGEIGLLSGVFDDVVFVPVRVRQSHFIVGTYYGEVGLLSGRVRRGFLSVGTCSARTAKCRDVSGDVGIGSGHFGRGWFIVWTFSARLVCYRVVFGRSA